MNAKKTGIQLNSNGDLNISIVRDRAGLIETGITIGDTLYQNQYVILKAQKGDIKEMPLLGVGIDGMANDEDALPWKKSIREEFAKDGLDVSELIIESEAMILKADYK